MWCMKQLQFWNYWLSRKNWGGKRNYDQWHTNLFTPFLGGGEREIRGDIINSKRGGLSSNCLNFNESLFLSLSFLFISLLWDSEKNWNCQMWSTNYIICIFLFWYFLCTLYNIPCITKSKVKKVLKTPQKLYWYT